MTTLLNLDTNRREIVYDRTNYFRTHSPASSVLLTGSESDSRISSSPSASEYSYSDSSNVFAMETLNLAEESSVSYMETDGCKPYIQITEQPIDKFRFRYKSEMHGTHGCLSGLSTNKVKKTFPTAELKNFHGEAIIRCSLFQVDTLTKLHHSHSLVVRKDNDDIKDPHDVEVSPSKGYTAVFVGMGIIHTAKRFIVEELHEKLVRRTTFEKGREITERENQQLLTRAENEAKNMNLNKVCLCFEAFYLIDDNWVSICEPALSNPINNMKSALTGELKITRLSTNISEANGNEDIFLFVEKVGKKNIKVRFFEVDENDEPIWEDWGRFSEVDVHHQYAIALRTPPYKDKDIEENVNCFIQLVRPSDQCFSDPKPFRYKPSRSVSSRKRARLNTPYSSAELPTTLHEMQTISKEFNKSGIIADVINQKTDSHQESFDNFLKFLSNEMNEDLDSLIDPNELLDSKEISKELKKLGPSNGLLRTDGVAVPNAEESSNELCKELLIPLMHKIIIRNSADVAADKIRSLFACEYENGRFIIDYLITYNPALFKLFLTYVERLRMPDLLDYQNDRKKSCFHIVCENCQPDAIISIVPTLIRLGADPNVTDYKGDTALHVIIRDDKLFKCADLFINGNYPSHRKLNLEIENFDSLTPLLLACRLNRVEIVHSLLKAGVSVDGAYKKDGNNVLHIAVSENSDELVSLLLSQTTIDVTRKNNADQMPIELAMAAEPQNRKILHVLKRRYDQFVSNKYPTDIKVEPFDADAAPSVIVTTQEYQESARNVSEYIFDDTCLEQLCHWFNRSDRWKRLARCMDLEAFVNVWASSKNPSRMLFKFSEVQGTSLKQIVDIFKQLNESTALVYIDEMIARQLEEDY
ncbi:nuclear factor NF-kappa-B p110 subunit isoform X3 [Bradysia coprophila]|uniref:nuclear factor NF-kappa-B p110 subunit isoform X3 n=2 Tax=Bradysia coprophila TaxID=38358 RepID=UPI00187DA2EC|nr:nuclear factor NF-kappa-B p110 subunit isoform X3 [Bradysia coprophila]